MCWEEGKGSQRRGAGETERAGTGDDFGAIGTRKSFICNTYIEIAVSPLLAYTLQSRVGVGGTLFFWDGR